MRKSIAAANWKMNLTWQQGEQLIDQLIAGMEPLADHKKVILAVPFPYLQMAHEKVKNQPAVFIAAQNCYSKMNGAYTGEVSVEMLQSIGIHFVVLGHSERREYFNESNQFLADKVNICLANNIHPIFCCGEPLAIREANTQDAYVRKQLEESLFHLSAEEIQKIVIAYEPIWAIGTGKTASSEQAQEMHASIRALLAEKYGTQVASEISILYGGSVKGNNALELFLQSDVDGGLVGGASLNAAEFLTIIKAL